MRKLSAFTQWFKNLSMIAKIILIVVIIATAWFGYTKLKPSPATTQQLQTAQITKGTLVVSTSVSGQVSSANNASVTTQSSGVVKKLFVKNGDVVKSGDKLVEMDLDQEAKQQYQQALSSYQGAKNNLESAKINVFSLQSKLFAANQKFIDGAVASGIPSSDTIYVQQNADWLASEATYKNQQNVIAQAQTALNNSWLSYQQSSPIIYAPISGTMNGLSLQVGAVLVAQKSSTGSTTSQRIASVVTTAEPTINVSLTEIDVPNIKIGNKATITIDALKDKTFTGKVISVDTVGAISSNVTTYPAVIKLDSGSTDIFPNMSAQANIITNVKDDVLLAPTSAVSAQNGQSTVRVMKNGTPQTTPVETGLSSNTQIEIVSGLAEGDTVVTSAISQSSTTGTRTGEQTTSPFSALGGGGRFGGVGGR